MIDPATIIKLRDTGTGDMATLADENPSPQFGLDVPCVLTAILAWVSGGTGGPDDLEIYQKIHARRDGAYDQLRRVLTDFGTDDTTFHDWRIDDKEQHHWVLNARDLWVPVWTNPDAGNMTWVLEFHIRPLG
jgi:hypothetical protein